MREPRITDQEGSLQKSPSIKKKVSISGGKTRKQGPEGCGQNQGTRNTEKTPEGKQEERTLRTEGGDQNRETTDRGSKKSINRSHKGGRRRATDAACKEQGEKDSEAPQRDSV